jgi:acyl carrier protein
VSEANVRETILATLRRLAETQTVELGQRLVKDLGLDSMDIAELVAVLEADLGLDPFVERVSIADVHTVAELLAAYEGEVK